MPESVFADIQLLMQPCGPSEAGPQTKMTLTALACPNFWKLSPVHGGAEVIAISCKHGLFGLLPGWETSKEANTINRNPFQDFGFGLGNPGWSSDIGFAAAGMWLNHLA
jgi:hypothetical protein